MMIKKEELKIGDKVKIRRYKDVCCTNGEVFPEVIVDTIEPFFDTIVTVETIYGITDMVKFFEKPYKFSLNFIEGIIRNDKE